MQGRELSGPKLPRRTREDDEEHGAAHPELRFGIGPTELTRTGEKIWFTLPWSHSARMVRSGGGERISSDIDNNL